MKILVTGGLGYIGSHTCVELVNAGYDVVILDNLSNSKIEVLDKIEEIVSKDIKFYKGDMIDGDLLDKIFKEEKIDSVIDFAAFKAVGESVKKPIEYYMNNVSTVLVLLKTMMKHNIKKIVFSSSATVYGDPEEVPIVESSKVGGTTNPYGTSKLMVEKILKDLYKSDNEWRICILRYFNPVGAHESHLIGEDPNGIPANLVPYISKVAIGELDHLNIFGADYETPDGTGVRDYIHIVDLAIGHVKAIEKIAKDSGLFIYNLGTGKGYSVLEMVNTYEKVNDVTIKREIVERREGDIATCFSDPTKAEKELGWKATRDLEKMCYDAYQFMIKNK